MKKIFLTLLGAASIMLADVSQTTIGCEDKSDLKEFLAQTQSKKIQSLEDFYKFSIENNCQFIEKGDTIRLLGKPYSDGTSLVYVKKYDKDLYVQTKVIQNKNTPENNKFNKSF